MFERNMMSVEKVLGDARALWREQSLAAEQFSKVLKLTHLALYVLTFVAFAVTLPILGELRVSSFHTGILPLAALAIVALRLRQASLTLTLPKLGAIKIEFALLKHPLAYQLSIQITVWLSRAREWVDSVRVAEFLPQFELPQFASLLNSLARWLRITLPALAVDLIPAFAPAMPGPGTLGLARQGMVRTCRVIVLRC